MIEETPPKCATVSLNPATTVPTEAMLDQDAPEDLDEEGVSVLLKKELIEEVANQLNLPKGKVRPIAEALLASIGTALEEGRSFKLPPLGRARVIKKQDVNGTVALALKLRRPQQDQS